MTAATAIEIGMVIIHAHSNLRVTPHRTADTLLRIPVPMMDPVIVCVVLTGIPICAVENKVIAPAVSAANPSKGVRWLHIETKTEANQPTQFYTTTNGKNYIEDKG